MKSLIAKKSLLGKIATASEAADLIKPGATIAMGGYSMSGYPKVVAMELARRQKEGLGLGLNLVTGANAGQLDDILVEAIASRAPMCASRNLAAKINSGLAGYAEQQMCRMPQLLRREAFGHVSVFVIEALGLTEEGLIVPTSSVGFNPHLAALADKVIVEINLAQPQQMRGLHDIHVPAPPPRRKPIPLTGAGERIGEAVIRLDPAKIAAIVESSVPDAPSPPAKSTPATDKIAQNLFAFLELEARGHWGGRLPPLQTGFGAIATSVAKALAGSPFSDIEFFCGGVGEAVLELALMGKAKTISTGGVEMGPRAASIMRDEKSLMRKCCVIRNGDVANSSEVISRLGLVALNTGIEADIYGNVNSSHIGGTKVVNGIGGGANFAQNAGLSVLLLPSTGKDGAISTIVPMVSHHDICEHDLDIIITEHGLADLRGLDDKGRARAIIGYCADPSYKDQLNHYLGRAFESARGHHPQLPMEAFEWHMRLKEKGTMLM